MCAHVNLCKGYKIGYIAVFHLFLFKHNLSVCIDPFFPFLTSYIPSIYSQDCITLTFQAKRVSELSTGTISTSLSTEIRFSPHSHSHSPFDQLDHNKVAAISRVEQQQTVRAGGLELKEQVHGCVGLQGGKSQIAASGPEAHRLGHNATHAEASVQLAVRYVAVLALVQVGYTVKR